jgi:serine phosphatase RsbU (regulator of sigma subunit)
VGYDAATREFEAQRRAAQELEIAKEVQARLFPQILPSLRTLDYTASAFRRTRSAEIIMISLTLAVSVSG